MGRFNGNIVIPLPPANVMVLSLKRSSWSARSGRYGVADRLGVAAGLAARFAFGVVATDSDDGSATIKIAGGGDFVPEPPPAASPMTKPRPMLPMTASATMMRRVAVKLEPINLPRTSASPVVQPCARRRL